MRGDRREAAAADRRDDRALRLDAARASRRDRLPRRGALRPRAPAARARPAPPRAAARSGSKRWPISRARPSRSSPHAASTIASSPRSPRFRSRVSMLPRSGSIESVGSSASSCAFRRADAVPMRMPGRESRRRRTARRADRRARGTRRPTSPSGSVDVMSFAECTATSIRRSSSASSSSLTKTPREPISPNGFVRSRSPARRDRDERDLDPGRAQRATAASSACVSASLLPRLPTRISTARPFAAPAGRTPTTPRAAPGRTPSAPAAAAGVALTAVPELQRSSSPRPKRCRTASA